MHSNEREQFDRLLERVLDELPAGIHELIERVPLVVEDHPSRAMLEDLDIAYRDELCGLYTGISLDEKSVMHSGTMPDVVHVFREGVVVSAEDEFGRVSEEELLRQIRITVLHELGHHHGLTERDLDELGYG